MWSTNIVNLPYLFLLYYGISTSLWSYTIDDSALRRNITVCHTVKFGKAFNLLFPFNKKILGLYVFIHMALEIIEILSHKLSIEKVIYMRIKWKNIIILIKCILQNSKNFYLLNTNSNNKYFFMIEPSTTFKYSESYT